MKMLFSFVLLFIFCINSYSYLIFPNTWLNSSDSYQIFKNDTLFSVPNALIPSSLVLTPSYWKFDDCVNFIDSEGLIDGIPDLIPMSTSSNSDPCIVRYNKIYELVQGVPEERRNWYGICRSTGSAIDIILNSNGYREWGSSMTGSGFDQKVDINTTLRHEYGHAYGLDHSSYSSSLMYDYEQDPYFPNRIITFTNDEVNGLKHVYEPPSIQIQNPYMLEGETYRVFYENESDEIEFRVTVPELQEYNSVIPPDIVPVGFFISMENLYSGDDASFTYLGNRTYSFTTNMKDLAAQLGASTMKLMTYNERSGWIESDYYSYNSPRGEITFEIAPKPTIESPLPNEIYHVRPSGGKDSVTDTLAIKVRVPEILGSYPSINIKIDDVYVNPGDITFDSEENVWVYNWDLSGETLTEYGKKYSIKAEIDGDPTDYDLSSVYLVEAILFEDFQTIVDFASAGWAVETFIYPPSTPYGWKLGLDLITAETGTRCAKSIYTYSLSFYDMLRTPAITIPSDPNIVTKLSYRLAYKKGSTAVNLSKLYFNIYDQNDNQITFNPALATVASSWIDVEYDLSSYAGQTIKLNWKHHYSSTTIYCENTQFAIDDVKVFQIPDMDSPNIDFIAGNVADLNEDMNLTLQFNDYSGIVECTRFFVDIAKHIFLPFSQTQPDSYNL